MSSLSVYPSGYDTVNYAYDSVSILHPLTDAVGANSTSTDYAQWNLTKGSGAESYVYYTFDLSSIPVNATINSVMCSAKGYISVSNGNNVSSSTMRLYSGSTAMGSATSLTTSATTYNMVCGTWTRAQLDNCKIKIYAIRGSKKTTSTYYNRFYGATLTVNYTVAATMYTVTATCNAGGTLSHNGAVSVEEGGSYSLTIYLNDGYDVGAATSNGTDIKSRLARGNNLYTYAIDNIQSNISIVITFEALPSGVGVYLKQNGVYIEGQAIYQKINDVWLEISKSNVDSTKRYAVIASPISEGGPYELNLTFGDNITSATASFNNANNTNLPAMVSVEAGTIVSVYGRYSIDVTMAYINIGGTNHTMTLITQAFYKTSTYSFTMPSQDLYITLYGTIGGGGGEIM